MSDALVAEMRSIARRAAEPWMPGDSVKAAIGRASRALGIGYRRTRSFWYGETVTVRAVEADRMRAAELQLLARRRCQLQREIAAIKARLEARGGADEALGCPPDRRLAAVDRRKGDSNG
jgi:hypothetical protein